MSSFIPRAPYTQQELDKLYPSNLELRQVQVILRHGERSPVSARFENAGLSPYWPYCHAAKRLTSAVMETTDWSKWGVLPYRRRLETFGTHDLPVIGEGPGGEQDGICQLGELTDKGRETTLALGQRLRRLYIDQLHFMPDILTQPDLLYIRSTPMPRALESVQQTYVGLYPTEKRDPSMPSPTIITRAFPDETLFPNEWNCKRYGELVAAFRARNAERWNDSKEIGYVNKKIGKWMPQSSPKVQVDGKPRLDGIMDTINATQAHGPQTKLPSEFYDPKMRDIIDKVAVQDWFAGYGESLEFRTLGIGGLIGDIVTRMVSHTNNSEHDGIGVIGDTTGSQARGRRGEQQVRFSLSGAHDTTIAGIVASLGAFDNPAWPPFTSHVAIELFQSKVPIPSNRPIPQALNQDKPGRPTTSWWASIIGGGTSKGETSYDSSGVPLARKPTDMLSGEERAKLRDYYVRIRYNDRPVIIPGCRAPGKHLDGDETLCTLEAFKAIADKFTPRDWKAQCQQNLGASSFPPNIEEAGFE